jgi:hypothetical protein
VNAQRIARNNATFRDANEGIRGAAERYRVNELVPFLCECADERCTELIRLSLTEYEAVRSHSTWFVVLRGHVGAKGGTASIVSERNEYIVVEKQGPAAELTNEWRRRDRPEL